MHVLAAALHQANEGVGHETGTDTVRNRVRQRHENNGQERRNTQTPVSPVDVNGLADHQEADHDQSRGDRLEGNDGDQRRDENRQQEQHTGHNVRKTGACARTDTGSGLNENLVRRTGCATTDNGTESVHEQDLVDVLDLAVLHGASLGGKTDRNAHRVEEHGQQNGEHQQRCGQRADVGERAEQVSGTDEGEVRGGELHVRQGRHVQGPAGGGILHPTGGDDRLQNQGQCGGGEHAPQDRALHVTDEQGDGEEQAEEEHEGGPAEQVTANAEAHRNGGASCVGHAADNAGVDQTDKGNEETDTDHNRGLKRLGDRLKHRGTEAGEHQNGHD